MSDTTIGRYRLLAELGRGGMSDVYLAASNGLGGFQKLVVIKVSRVSDDPAFAQMFLDEARLSARLTHSNIVQTYEVGEENGRQYIVMEYLDGPSLYLLNRLSAGMGGVPLRMLVQILSGVLTGLHYAHTLKDFDGTPLCVVHRDVSPQNIMITSQGECKLLDFGIAKTSDSRTMTQAGFYRGKLNYMSPEQALGNPVDARADVFSVGVLLAEAITRKPFWGEGTTAVISARLIHGEIPDIEQAGIEPLLEEICKGALMPDREQRTASAQDFKGALDLYLGTVGGPVSTEELAAFIAPLVAQERQRFNAMIDQQLNQVGAPISVNVPLPNPSRPPMSSHATLTPMPFRSRGSGYTPISSQASISAASGTDNAAPATASAQVPYQSRPSQVQPLPPEPPSYGGNDPMLSEGPSPSAPRAPKSDRGVRTAARRPDPPENRDSTTRLIVGLVAAGFAVLVGLVVWLASRQPVAPRPTPVAEAPIKEPAHEAPKERRVEIAVQPPGATLELDGAPVSNPFTTAKVDGRSHKLVARADGFEVLSREVMFDRDLSVNWSMQPLAVREQPANRPPPAVVEVAPPQVNKNPPAVVIRRPPPKVSPPARPGVVVKDEPTQPDSNTIQELTPKKPPTVSGKQHTIDTEVFDDKKQEIDRNTPWEN